MFQQARQDPAAEIRERLERNGSSGSAPQVPSSRQDIMNSVPRAG